MNAVAAGIVTYNADVERLEENINSLLKQVDKIYICDNGSDNIASLRLLFSANQRIVLTENGKNLGIATALNILCNNALLDGYEWLLTMDQDSVANDNLVESYSKYADFEKVGIICPCVDDDNENNVFSDDIEPFDEIDRCITSASLNNLSVWKVLGGFDERMFIDCVDFDYCTRVVAAGYKIIRDNNTFVYHRLGKAIPVKVLIPLGRFLKKPKWVKPLYTYNHSPQRTYYYARNIRYYVHKNREFVDVRKERKIYFRWLVLKLLFEPQKFKKLSAILKGKRDAKKMIKEYDKKILNGKDLNKIENYLFDFDGTLVDSMPYWAGRLLELLNESKVEYPKNIINIITPLGFKKTCEYLNNLGLDASEDDITDSLRPLYQNEIPLKPFVKDKLSKLKASGKHLNVLTASPHDFVDDCLRRNGIYDLFDNVWTSEDFDEPKTNPVTYIEAVRRINGTLKNTAFLDDNISACTAASKSGIITIGVFDETSLEAKEEIKKVSDKYIENFSEL